MTIMRRVFLTGALSMPALLFTDRRSRAHQMFEGIPVGKAFGDYGYKHDQYHLSYQKWFGENGHCLCGDGECRVTNWRKTLLQSPKGYDVIVDRQWWPLPSNVWMPDDLRAVPRDLWQERAHVCAYGAGNGTTIPCALINSTQA